MAPARRRHARARSVGPLASTSTVAGLLALLATPEFWLRLLEISVLNLFLSGDNAVVIALAVRVLPKRQRLQGQIWGTVGAVGLRMAFVGLVSAMLRVPFLRLGGGCALLWIAYRLVRPALAIEDTTGRHGASFWEAIWIIVAADVTMSLDNVLAIAAAAHDDYFLIVVGIAMSIPIVVWGSGHLARLMNRFPWIIWAGGALLGWVAGEMLLEDPAVLAARVRTHDGDILFHKHWFDVFTNPNVLPVLDALAPSEVVLYGVALDVCDKYAIEGLRRHRPGIPVTLVTDATRAINPEAAPALLAEWAARGVRFTTSAAVLAA